MSHFRITLSLTTAVLLVACLTRQPLPPRIDRIDPTGAAYQQSVSLSIFGAFYVDTYASFNYGSNNQLNTQFQARLGVTPLSPVAFENSNELTAIVPATLQVGTYDLIVVDPTGVQAALPRAFQVGVGADTKTITQFTVLGIDAVISGNLITLSVPHGTDITNLVPAITFDGASISPESGVAQNFSTPVRYVVTAADDTTRTYTVTVTVSSTGCTGSCSCSNGTCDMSCPAGGCGITCNGTATCTGDCSDNCTTACSNSADCGVQCDSGCSYTCSGATTCSPSCTQGCAMTCGNSAICDLRCGAGCSYTCSGGAVCSVQCSSDCRVSACDGSAKCSLTCTDPTACRMTCRGHTVTACKPGVWVCGTACP